MSANIRYPNITGVKPEEQIMQIKSYLYQLVEQLNWMLPAIESIAGQAGTSTNPSMGDISSETFYELKSLLIQSSDTLNAYYEKINTKLEGQYVKQTAFDDYKQENIQRFIDLGSQFVEKTDFNDYKQEMVQRLVDLGSQYVEKAAFNEHKQEVYQNITDLQQSASDMNQRIDELQQIINSMQETGG